MTATGGQTALLLVRTLRETLRAPAWIVTGLSTPLLYLALFAPVLEPLAGGPGFHDGDVLDVFVPGILVLMAFGAGMGAGWIVIDELRTGVLERLRVTPTSRLALLLGPVLRDVLMLLVPAVLVILVALPFGYRPHLGGTAVLLLLLALLTALVSAWSNALGLVLKDIGSLAAIVTGLQLPLILLSGILLPLAIAPDWIRVLAHLNPLYYAVTAARDLSAGAILTADVGYAFLITSALTALTFTWAMRVYRRAVA
jgi:ABC-2 type transport system permease protein